MHFINIWNIIHAEALPKQQACVLAAHTAWKLSAVILLNLATGKDGRFSKICIVYKKKCGDCDRGFVRNVTKGFAKCTKRKAWEKMERFGKG